MKQILLLLLAIFLVPVVFANPVCDYMMQEMGITTDMKLPGFLPYGNERINVYTQNVEIVGHIVTEKKIITSISCDVIEDETYVVKVANVGAVQSVMEAESPVDALNSALGDTITVEPKTTMKTVTNFFARMGLGIASWFV